MRATISSADRSADERAAERGAAAAVGRAPCAARSAQHLRRTREPAPFRQTDGRSPLRCPSISFMRAAATWPWHCAMRAAMPMSVTSLTVEAKGTSSGCAPSSSAASRASASSDVHATGVCAARTAASASLQHAQPAPLRRVSVPGQVCDPSPVPGALASFRSFRTTLSCTCKPAAFTSCPSARRARLADWSGRLEGAADAESSASARMTWGSEVAPSSRR
jgi:hypothetical protein